MIEVGKVYVEPIYIHSDLTLQRNWKVLHKVSDELCFVTNEEGRYEIKNISKYKEGRSLAERVENLKRIMSQ